MRRLALVVAACLPTQMVQTSECRVACQWAGYDSGDFDGEHCRCWDLKDYSTMTHEKRLHIGKKADPKNDRESSY